MVRKSLVSRTHTFFTIEFRTFFDILSFIQFCNEFMWNFIVNLNNLNFDMIRQTLPEYIIEFRFIELATPSNDFNTKN